MGRVIRTPPLTTHRVHSPPDASDLSPFLRSGARWSGRPRPLGHRAPPAPSLPVATRQEQTMYVAAPGDYNVDGG